MMKKSIIAGLLTVLIAFSAFAEKTVTATVLQKDMALWNEKSEGMMEWAKISLEPGDTIEAYISGTDENNKPVPETKRSSWTSAKEGQTLSFTKVKYDGKDYYAISNRIAPGKTPALVVEDAGTYMSKNFADIRKKGVTLGTIIAVDTSDTTNNDSFSLISMSYYDEAGYVMRQGYILKSKVSTTKDDISGYNLLMQALSETDEARKTAILNSIKQLDTSSALEKIKVSLVAKEEEVKKLKDLTPWGIEDYEDFCIIEEGAYTRTDDSVYDVEELGYVNARSLPGMDGEVLVQFRLERGSSRRRTIETVTIDGITEHWYEIEFNNPDPDSNESLFAWVFGGYIRHDYINCDPW